MKKNLNFYHYTIFQHLLSIHASGGIKTTTLVSPNKDKPCVWLSTNPSWEKTVMKALRNSKTGNERQYYSREALFNCEGWGEGIGPGQLQPFIPVRIELDKSKISLGSKQPGKTALFTWRHYRKNSGESHAMLKKLVKVGKKQGANPKQWFVSYEEIPTFNCCSFERWDGNTWVELTTDDIVNSLPLYQYQAA